MATSLQSLLNPDVECLIWNKGVFKPGEYALESLQRASQECDGSIVIATADDHVTSRGADSMAPRDNILFESGLFIAVFGRLRALLLVQDVSTTKLPSDLGGLNVLTFERTDPPEVGLGPAATGIRGLAEEWRDMPFDQEVASRVERVLQIALSQLQHLEGISDEVGLHVFVVDRKTDPPQLVRVARARTNPKPPRAWPPFSSGVGIVGLSWERCAPVFVDLSTEEIQRIGRDDWDALSKDERNGMDFEMLVASRSRYKCVGSIPITTIHGDFIGCLSFNLGTASGADVATMSSGEVERVLDACAVTIAIVTGH